MSTPLPTNVRLGFSLALSLWGATDKELYEYEYGNRLPTDEFLD